MDFLRLFSIRIFLSLALILPSVLTLGCSGKEQAPPPAPDTSSANRPASIIDFEAGASPSGQQLPGQAPGSGSTELTWTIPAGWQQETPSSSMRKAQYKIPAASGDAELVVFYFGPGQGGDARSNAQRWANQFTQPDGRSPLEALETEETQVQGMKVMLVETSGNYQNSMAPMAAASTTSQAGQMLLASIVEGPDANWFFKLTGPKETVESQREAFQQFTQSIRVGN